VSKFLPNFPRINFSYCTIFISNIPDDDLIMLKHTELEA
jgi:hypothetical protein